MWDEDENINCRTFRFLCFNFNSFLANDVKIRTFTRHNLNVNEHIFLIVTLNSAQENIKYGKYNWESFTDSEKFKWRQTTKQKDEGNFIIMTHLKSKYYVLIINIYFFLKLLKSLEHVSQ